MKLFHLSSGAGESIDGIYSTLEKAKAAYIEVCKLASATFSVIVAPEEFEKLSEFQYRAAPTKDGYLSASYILVYTLDETPFNNL